VFAICAQGFGIKFSLHAKALGLITGIYYQLLVVAADVGQWDRFEAL